MHLLRDTATVLMGAGGAALTAAYFFGAQLLFAVWNAANDPLFGWLSDDGAAARACCSHRFAARWGALAPLQRRASNRA
jgi:hypothetical protein